MAHRLWLQAKISEIKYLPTGLLPGAIALSREVALSARAGAALSPLMTDAGHVKAMNDRYGYAGGDIVRKRVAETILDACRVGDFVFR
ncbi:hypothetical protein GCM10011504_41090 [Siccirubricoccus deserti]|uniref:Diguanylate cyclase n=1 Tax=Siccirubricoccus deserti TaxID=2013562 RepID=A0A9X0R0B3_9PROT|nr:diguanylate cyclase [Siccirubricoccus deserti]MBC4017346.1 diguanylate cyclase [Siccirubricoccus deserti]GGC58673.1 hypothetical protein GCM10011504_41090 [Siccirubricoccus deserti]